MIPSRKRIRIVLVLVISCLLVYLLSIGSLKKERIKTSFWPTNATSHQLSGGQSPKYSQSLVGSLKNERTKTSFWPINATSHRLSGGQSSQYSQFHTSSLALRDLRHLLITYEPYGRLGNQMFQYAGLLGIARMNNRTPFIQNRGGLLTRAFQLSYLKPVTDTKHYKLIGDKHYGTYDPQFESLPEQNIVLQAYLQSFKYFKNILNVIKEEFKFIDRVDGEADKIFKLAQNSSGYVITVGVHVRRGDMLGKKDADLGDVVPSKIYFQNAMDWMRTKYGRVKFLVTSDDLSWTEKNLKGPDVVVLRPASSEVHLATLSKCRHVIMSIGTFGWWAGLLAGGDVIYFNKPHRPGSAKYKAFSMQDHYFPHWIGLEDFT